MKASAYRSGTIEVPKYVSISGQPISQVGANQRIPGSFSNFELRREAQTSEKMSVVRLEKFIHNITLTRLRGSSANVPPISGKAWSICYTGDTGTPHGTESP